MFVCETSYQLANVLNVSGSSPVSEAPAHQNFPQNTQD